MKTKKLRPRKFREAAQNLFNRYHDGSFKSSKEFGGVGLNRHLGCCWAIEVAVFKNYGLRNPDSSEILFFDSVLCPSGSLYGHWYGPTSDGEALEARILGLLLCEILATEQPDIKQPHF